MDFLSIQDVSNKWNISKRRVQILCREGRIDGAKMIGNMWVVPENVERPADARTKNPVVEKKKSYSLVRSELKKLLKCLYKKADENEYSESDKKIYVMSILAGVLCSFYIETTDNKYETINQIYFDISGKRNPYEIDKDMVNMATDFFELYKNDKDVASVVSWAYQYSNKIGVNSDYSNTQFFTEKYMIDFIVHHIKELPMANKILDPCSGGGNFLVECLDYLCAGATECNVEDMVISQTRKLYGYDIDDVIAKIAIVNIRIKALSIIREKKGKVKFDIWKQIIPNIFCAAEKDFSVGSLAKDNRKVCNALTREVLEHDKALGNANVLVTNPPFASVKGMSKEQKEFLKEFYPLANCDTCVAFMEAIGNLLSSDGVCGIVSQNAWMYLKSFAGAREKYVNDYNFRYIANLGSGAFIDLSGEKSNVSLIVFEKKNKARVPLVRVTNLSMDSLADKIKKLKSEAVLFEVEQERLNGVNGFSLSENNALDLKQDEKEQYSSVAVPMQGTSTGNSKELVGFFWEHFGDQDWIPVSNGGGYCRWEGLNNSVVKWGIDGEYIKAQKGSALRNVKYFEETQLVFSDTGTAGLNVRLLLNKQIFIASGPGIRLLQGNKYAHMAFLNSRLAANYVRTISPKLTIAAGYIGRVPVETGLLNSTILERKARLCVDLKCKHLQSRPNNLEYIDVAQIGSEIDLEQQAWELFKSDILNELLKLELESQCDDIILSEFSFGETERNSLTEAVGECAFDIETVQEIDIPKFDKYLAKLLDDACMLKRSRTSKASLGCDGVLEYAAKDLSVNPASLVEQLCQSACMMRYTLEKYKDLILHNYILHEMGYSVTTGVSKELMHNDELIKSFEAVYGEHVDITRWLESKFNEIHCGVFKGKPFIYYEDGEIRKYGKSV